MATYYFDITEEKINSMSVSQYEALERMQDGSGKLYLLRPVICHFMAKEDGTPIPENEALRLTEKFSLAEMKSFIEQFFGSFKQSTVPNGNGSPSQ